MAEDNIPDPGSQPDQNLLDEFRTLGVNLTNVLRTAWDRPERQKLQQDLEGGITELGNTLRREAKSISENPVSQRVKTEVTDFGDRVRSGEIEAKVRTELIHALQLVNKELDNLSKVLATSPQPTEADNQVQDQPAVSGPADQPAANGPADQPEATEPPIEPDLPAEDDPGS